jgi:hypothetical protein
LAPPLNPLIFDEYGSGTHGRAGQQHGPAQRRAGRRGATPARRRECKDRHARRVQRAPAPPLRRMKVVIREAAEDDLDRIFAWIAKGNPRAAGHGLAHSRAHQSTGTGPTCPYGSPRVRRRPVRARRVSHTSSCTGSSTSAARFSCSRSSMARKIARVGNCSSPGPWPFVGTNSTPSTFFAHAGTNRTAMATPAANARNDSTAITGTGGRGAAAPIDGPMDMCGASPMPA